MRTAIILLVILGGLMAFFRLNPVDATTGRERPAAQAVGDYPLTGGHYAVRLASEIDAAALTRAIEQTVRTRKLADGVYVTRSLIWGFPDITHIWEEAGNTHVFSHLVYGRSDLGVNRKRIEGWLQDAAQ